MPKTTTSPTTNPEPPLDSLGPPMEATLMSVQMNPTTTPPRSLVAKLADVMLGIEYVPKRGHNDFHNYDYATEADIVAAVRLGLASRGILLVPAVTAMTRESVGEKGSVLTTLSVEFTFIDGETGETLMRPWMGAGTDKEDKGLYKAMTGAVKYFLLKTFLLPTGDDPERDNAEADAGAPSTAAPTRPSAAAPRSDGQLRVVKIWDDKKPYGVVFSDQQKFTTFDEAVLATAREAKINGLPVHRKTTSVVKGDRTFHNLTGLRILEESAAAGADPDDAIPVYDEEI